MTASACWVTTLVASRVLYGEVTTSSNSEGYTASTSLEARGKVLQVKIYDNQVCRRHPRYQQENRDTNLPKTSQVQLRMSHNSKLSYTYHAKLYFVSTVYKNLKSGSSFNDLDATRQRGEIRQGQL